MKWKLVPTELTEEMRNVMLDCEKEERIYSVDEAWKALLDAAPTQPPCDNDHVLPGCERFEEVPNV